MILKPPGNGIFKLLDFKGKRSFPKSMVGCVKRNGKRFCAWCAEHEIGENRAKKYCSKICSISFLVYARPTKYPATEFIYLRQKQQCAICFYQYAGKLSRSPINISPEHKRPEFDHIIPVALGGQTFGIDNIQMLCKTCHAVKTKKDVQDIKAARCLLSPGNTVK